MTRNILRAAALVSGMIFAGGAHAACLEGYDCGIVTGKGSGNHTCAHFTLSDDLEGNNPREYAIITDDKSTSGALWVVEKNQSLSLLPGITVTCQNQQMPSATALHNPAKQQ